MVLERFRNLALRKRRSNAVATTLPATSSHSNLIEDIANDNPTKYPSSPHQPIIQATQNSIEATSQTRDVATQTKPATDLHIDQTMDNDETKAVKKHAAKKAAKKKPARKATRADRRRELESQFLAMAEVVTTDGNAIADSGLAVSQHLNETAREILEAKTITAKMDHEIAQLTNQMGLMELRFNSIYVEFSRARATHLTSLDYSHVESHRESVLAEMLKSMELIHQKIQDESFEVSEWPMAKVHNILSPGYTQSLDQLHKQNKNLYNFSDINTAICSTMDQFRKIEFDGHYHHLLIVGLRPVDLVRKLCKDDRGLAKAHEALGPTAGVLESKIGTTKIRKEGLSESQLQLVECMSLSTKPEYLAPSTEIHDPLMQSSSGLTDLGCLKCNVTQSAAHQEDPECSEKPVSCTSSAVAEDDPEVFCESFFREICAMGKGVMGIKSGEEYAMQVLDDAFYGARVDAKDTSKTPCTLEDTTESFCSVLENFEKISAAHLKTCDVCKKGYADFVAKEQIML